MPKRFPPPSSHAGRCPRKPHNRRRPRQWPGRSSRRKTSNVYPRRHEYVLHIEREPQKHFDGKREHRHEQKRRDRKPHGSPAFHELSTLDPQHPGIKEPSCHDEVGQDAEKAENSRPDVIAKPDEIRKV